MIHVVGRRDALTAFLEWAHGRLGLRSRGFANFKGTLAKRIARRTKKLGLDDLDAYRAYLEAHEDEWPVLDAMCRITISRLYRDASVMDRLARDVLPSARRVWSAGCASGEEPYTVALLAPQVEIVATDIDGALIERARRGEFGESSLRELPLALRERLARGRDALRARITFRVQDLRREAPEGPFDVVLCRNVAFTYFDEAEQRVALRRIAAVLAPGGTLVIGKGESLPEPGSNVPFFTVDACLAATVRRPPR
jgi:chemotaxis protein methyltransferase CheR